MARIGAKTVHSIDKNKISKFFGIFLLAVSIKFFYEYLKLKKNRVASVSPTAHYSNINDSLVKE